MSSRRALPARLTEDGRLYRPFDLAAKPILASLPGARWEGGYWKVSLDEGDRHRVLEVADQLGVTVASALRLPLNVAGERARTAGLYPFQVDGVDWLSRRGKALLADEMGLGKTAQALLALPEEAAALVVCPACLKYNWREEAARWRPDFTRAVVERRKHFRLPAAGQMVVVSYDSLPDNPGPAGHVHLVADESHKLKGRNSRRGQRFRKLSGSAQAVWALTGTPLLNEPGELFAMLKALNMVAETFGGWNRYLELFNARKGEWNEMIWGKPKPEVPELLRRVMLRRLRSEVLPDLPSKYYQNLVVPLPTGEAGLAAEMDDLWGRWRQYLGERDDLPPFPAFSAVRERLARTRIKVMKQAVEMYEEDGQPLVVFSAHRAPVEALAGRPGWKGILGDTSSRQRQAITERFQAGELKGVALTIGAGGEGLTMTRASTVLFVDLDWVPAKNVQAEDRVCRIGQAAGNVRVVRMVSDHVLDRRVLEVLHKKAELARAVVEAA
jgi:SWI/SNF-related matrix-associated actin-dependent regulator 1 of chromatin subfamily A